jgi:hypothetical protein
MDVRQNYCEADFSVFASLLGYAFDGENPVGRHAHSPGTKRDKDKLVDLYDSTGIVGFINGLLPLYDQLVRIFREKIAPSGGNNDDIRTSLVDLVYLAHECASSSDRDEDFEGFRSIENKIFPTKTNKNSQDLIYEMQNNERERLDLYTLVDRTAETFR